MPRFRSAARTRLVVRARDEQWEVNALFARVRKHGPRDDARALPNLGHGLAERETEAGDERMQEDLRPAQRVSTSVHELTEAGTERRDSLEER
jgi:hypothetical protein